MNLGQEIENVRRTARQALRAAVAADDRLGKVHGHLRIAHGGRIRSSKGLGLSQQATSQARAADAEVQRHIRRALNCLGEYRRAVAPGLVRLGGDRRFDEAVEGADDLADRAEDLTDLIQLHLKLARDASTGRGGADAVFRPADAEQAEVHDHGLLVVLVMLVLSHRFRKKG